MGYLYEACDQISDFCHQVAEKNVTINILGRTEGQMEGQTDVKILDLNIAFQVFLFLAKI